MKTTISSTKDLLKADLNCLQNTESILYNTISRWNHADVYAPLRLLIYDYQAAVKHHIDKLMNLYDERRGAYKMKGYVIDALIDEADEKLHACEFHELEYASLIGSLQAVIHYKISCYGSAAAYANTSGLSDIAETLHQAVLDEKEFDHRFSHLALHDINQKAVKLPLY